MQGCCSTGTSALQEPRTRRKTRQRDHCNPSAAKSCLPELVNSLQRLLGFKLQLPEHTELWQLPLLLCSVPSTARPEKASPPERLSPPTEERKNQCSRHCRPLLPVPQLGCFPASCSCQLFPTPSFKLPSSSNRGQDTPTPSSPRCRLTRRTPRARAANSETGDGQRRERRPSHLVTDL